jgi:hypothetical protein
MKNFLEKIRFSVKKRISLKQENLYIVRGSHIYSGDRLTNVQVKSI